MPNFCSNTMVITGDKEIISKLTDIIKNIPSEVGFFETLVGVHPNPEGNDDENWYKQNWYNANIEYWGTKWDIVAAYSNYHPSYHEDNIVINMETAWSPPIAFCKTLSQKYKVSVEITYTEQGMDFAGRFFIDEQGNENHEQYTYMEGVYKYDNEFFWSELEYLIIIDEDFKPEYDFLTSEEIERLNKLIEKNK